MPDIQTTFQDVQEVKKIKALTDRQRQVLILLGKGFWQGDISDRLHISRPRVCQITKILESRGLIKKKIETEIKGPREYKNFYEVVPEAKIPGTDFNICHVHRIRMKFKILNRSGPSSTDKRTGYNYSKNLRGGPRHVFWFPGKTPLPNITVEDHIKTLMIYMDKGQMITARDMDQAEEIAWYSVYQARDRFVDLQGKFGTTFEIETTGTRIDKVEYGFIYHKDSGVKEAVQPVPPNWWIDKSVEPEFPNHEEFETNVRPEAQQVQSAITQLKHMPEVMQQFNDRFGEVNNNVLQVLSQLQGGRPVEGMFLQAVDLLARMTDRMNRLEDELREIKKKQIS